MKICETLNGTKDLSRHSQLYCDAVAKTWSVGFNLPIPIAALGMVPPKIGNLLNYHWPDMEIPGKPS